MSAKKTTDISLLAFLLFALELFIYLALKMHPVLRAGTLASGVAYSFLWLTALTLAVAIGLPLGDRIARKMGQEDLSSALSMGAIGLVMVGFTALAFVKASKLPGAIAGQKIQETQAEKLAEQVSNYLEYVDSEVTVTDPETIEMVLKFKSKSKEDITELDYAFVALEGAKIFYKIKIREAVFIPALHEGSTTLTWERSRLKNPELFARFLKAQNEKSLRVYAKPVRVVLANGNNIEE